MLEGLSLLLVCGWEHWGSVTGPGLPITQSSLPKALFLLVLPGAVPGMGWVSCHGWRT